MNQPIFRLEQLLSLHYIYPLTLNKFQKLLLGIGSLDKLPQMTSTELANILQITTNTAKAILEKYSMILKNDLIFAYNSQKIHVVPYNHPVYPKKLLELVDPPTILYGRGDISLLQSPNKIAIIGSRKATNYSKQALDCIVPPLIEQNFVIVSGLAKGADSFAHHAALQFGGKTIGVLGHGLFHLYPRENSELAAKMAIDHLLITEYPPYVGVQKWHFPMRNRIISGISNALVVTESSLKSGTLITTDHALEHGKDVFVVPGPIHSEQSKGTNKLLKDGAIPVWNGYQILEEIKLF
ncbi:DNA-processing protein DprA [Ureibacillus composti]|nr:DNA-processing protein DprA [Ureibacillus composti]